MKFLVHSKTKMYVNTGCEVKGKSTQAKCFRPTGATAAVDVNCDTEIVETWSLED